MVGVKFEVERVACGIYGSAHKRGALVFLVDVGIDINAFGVVVPMTLDVGVAERGVVI